MKKTMFRILGCILLMMLSWGCSDSSKDQKEGEAPSISEIEGEKQQDLSQEPKGGIPELTEEDKRLAAQAPEGMVFIKGSCFTMGNDEAQADEKYEHEVCLDSFYLDQYEVTQAEWEKVMGFNPSKIIKPDHPVEQVNYHDIQKFIKKSPRSCRLPTEAEWEYAARGGAVTGYFWGNVMDGTYAWFEDNSEGTTHPVGKKKPNAFGLYDMMGNVWEWTEDWYTPLYVGIKETNPTGPETGENKVIRGGSFNSSAGALRITNRTWLNPKNRVYSKISNYGGIVNEVFNYIGFRCAQSLSSPNTDEKPPADSGKEMPEQK